MKKQFSEETGPIFPTLDLKDKRLPNKEQVWGININDEQAAFTKTFLQKNPIYSFTLGGEPLVIVYNPQYDFVNAFKRKTNGKIVKISKVDSSGKTDQGKLEKIPLHNGVFWMIWSHWYPNTKVYSEN